MVMELDVNEVVEIDSPSSFGENDFIFGVKHSFSKPHDYYNYLRGPYLLQRTQRYSHFR